MSNYAVISASAALGIAQNTPLQEILSLQQEVASLKRDKLVLQRKLNENITLERERDIAMEEYHRIDGELSALKIELEYARLEKNQAKAIAEEVQQLKLWKANTLAICAIPWTQALDSVKLAWITGREQVPYSASKHGGPEDAMITSMKQWNIAVGGNPANTNKICSAVAVLEAGRACTKTEVNCGDGKQHFAVEFDENMLRQPRMFKKEDAPNPHNGGDKRHCPNPDCDGELQKDVRVSYICKKCTREYDRDLQPIQYQQVVKESVAFATNVVATPVIEPAEKISEVATNVVQFTPRMEMGKTPLPPSHCYNCGTTTPTDFKWNGFKWVCHSSRKTGCL